MDLPCPAVCSCCLSFFDLLPYGFHCSRSFRARAWEKREGSLVLVAAGAYVKLFVEVSS